LAGEPHPAHYVGLEKAEPVVVGDLLEVLWLEDAEVVDEYVYLGYLQHQLVDALRRTEVGRHAEDLGLPRPLLHAPHCLLDSLLRTAVDNHRCALLGQPRNRREPDAGSRSRHQSTLVSEL
jgi:hypothetical protein